MHELSRVYHDMGEIYPNIRQTIETLIEGGSVPGKLDLGGRALRESRGLDQLFPNGIPHQHQLDMLDILGVCWVRIATENLLGRANNKLTCEKYLTSIERLTTSLTVEAFMTIVDFYHRIGHTHISVHYLHTSVPHLQPSYGIPETCEELLLGDVFGWIYTQLKLVIKNQGRQFVVSVYREHLDITLTPANILHNAQMLLMALKEYGAKK